MIDLYYAPTPNGHKITLFLEEAALDYRLIKVDISKGNQFRPDFLAISPNNKIPAIVDHNPLDGGTSLSLFESGAILLYLAEKSGLLLSGELRERHSTLQWLFWQVGGLGPMLGQHGHFKLYAPERIAYATDRYRTESLRLYGVLDRRLADTAHVAGPDYSIADMACFPWVQTWKAQEIALGQFPHVEAWYQKLKERPALRRGMDVGRAQINRRPQDDADARRLLFGIKEEGP